ncbi:MAG: shikimate kinase [Coriobacteriia bacterium]|nr:shikimate kinase [Coriobacteriia bacterium]
MSHVFLIGFMGAGKSTVAREVGERLDRPVVDLDRVVESSSGYTIPEIFESAGEQGFRALESAALAELADAPASIVACGGGIVISDENRVALKRQGSVIYLRVSPEETLARVGADKSRPLLSGPEGELAAARLLDSRETLYAAVADATIETVGLSMHEVADAAVQAIKERGL